jgi:hypothetical protein
MPTNVLVSLWRDLYQAIYGMKYFRKGVHYEEKDFIVGRCGERDLPM